MIWALYTKAWMSLPVPDLGELVAELGFDAVELPIRPGAQVTPDTVGSALGPTATQLRSHGLQIMSVAAPATADLARACHDAGIGRIRIMADLIDGGERASIEHWKRHLGELAAVVGDLGIEISVQPHFGAWISTTTGILEVLADLPAENFTLAWDSAHAALAGEMDVAATLDLARDRLGILNLKDAILADSGSGARPRFVPAGTGLADWPAALGWVRASGWAGPVCLTAEYTQAQGPRLPELSTGLVATDLARAKEWAART